MSYGVCPSCERNLLDTDVLEEDSGVIIIEIKDRRRTDTAYGPGENWTEVWRCPSCAHEWEERNGYP